MSDFIPAMTNPTQPVEHFTMEQVEQKAEKEGAYIYPNAVGETVARFRMEELHALLNAAINELIGEPVAYKVNRVHSEGKGALCDDPKLLKEAADIGCKITPLYTLKEIKP